MAVCHLPGRPRRQSSHRVTTSPTPAPCTCTASDHSPALVAHPTACPLLSLPRLPQVACRAGGRGCGLHTGQPWSRSFRGRSKPCPKPSWPCQVRGGCAWCRCGRVREGAAGLFPWRHTVTLHALAPWRLQWMSRWTSYGPPSRRYSSRSSRRGRSCRRRCSRWGGVAWSAAGGTGCPCVMGRAWQSSTARRPPSMCRQVLIMLPGVCHVPAWLSSLLLGPA